MIIRLLLLLLLPLIAYWLAQQLTQRFAFSQGQRRWLFISFAALLVVAVLIVLGRLPLQFILAPLGLVATALFRLLPAMLRFLPMLRMLKGRASAAQPRSKGQESTLRTRFLAMVLDHEAARMHGEVLEGRFVGRELSSLAHEDFQTLLDECRGDEDSLQLLQAFLAREHPEWRFSSQAEGPSGSAGGGQDDTMTRDHALDILGLEEGAERAEIVAAHRDLMRKLHPDRGGNDYLAQKVNAAKDFLLE